MFFIRSQQESSLDAEWRGMNANVADLDALQQQIRRFHPWFDRTPTTVQLLESLFAAFPEAGDVWAKSIVIKGATVTCTGFARDQGGTVRPARTGCATGPTRARSTPNRCAAKTPCSSSSFTTGGPPMTANLPRETLLKIVAGTCAALLILNYVVLNPALAAWSAQSERIEALQKKVVRGRTLLERETLIRNHWAAMLRENMSDDNSTADNDAFKAISRWTTDSNITLSSVTPQFQAHDDGGYDAFEYRLAAIGDQVAVGRFLYDLGTDAMPCSLEECEITTRDGHGSQLTLSARFSFVRVDADSGKANNTASSNGRSRTNAD